MEHITVTILWEGFFKYGLKWWWHYSSEKEYTEPIFNGKL